MMVATALILVAAFNRWWGDAIYEVMGEAYFGTLVRNAIGPDLMIAGLAGYDLVTRGRIHPAIMIAAARRHRPARGDRRVSLGMVARGRAGVGRPLAEVLRRLPPRQRAEAGGIGCHVAGDFGRIRPRVLPQRPADRLAQEEFA